MYDKRVTSLCAVVITNNGKAMLFRVADITEGRLEPYTLDTSREFDDVNRDLIYHPPAGHLYKPNAIRPKRLIA